MSYLKDREIWLSSVPTGNPPAGYVWVFIQNGVFVVRDSNGVDKIMATTTGTVTNATSASYVEYSNVANKPALISGSSQVSFNGITDKPALVSSSAQIVGYGVFATTGSNQFNGSQAVTGSLTVTGQVVAQTLNVQQVTSSIVYSSGSNIFGNSLGNTQQFTGSVSVTGSLTSNGALTGTSATFRVSSDRNLATRFDTNIVLSAQSDTAAPESLRIYADTFRLFTATTAGGLTERLTISNTGNVGIGAINPGSFVTLEKSSNSGSGLTFPRLVIKNTLATQGDGSSTFNFADINISSGNEAVNMFLATTFAAGTWAPAGIINVSTNHELQFKTNNTTRLTLTNSGAAIFASSVTTNAANNFKISSGPYNAVFHNESTSTSDYNAIRVTQGAVGSATGYIGTGGSAVGNTSFQNTFVIGTQTSNALVLNTNDAERMRITSAGLVGIGTGAATLTEKLEVFGSIRALQTSNDGIAQFAADASNTSSLRCGLATFGSTAVGNLIGLARASNSFLYKNGGTLAVGTEGAFPLILSAGDAERMRITSGGNVGIGNTNPSGKLSVNDAVYGEYLRVATGVIGGNQTSVFLAWNNAGNISLQQVTVGAADSGGSGFRLLRIPNT